MNKSSCFSQKKIGGHSQLSQHSIMLRHDRKSTKNVYAVEEEKCDHLSNVDRWIEILTEVAEMKAHINHGLDYEKGEEDDDKNIEYEYDGDDDVDDEYDDNDDDDDIPQELNDVLIDIKQGERSDHTRKRSNVKRNSDIESSSIPDLVSFTEGSFSNDHRSSIGTSNIPLGDEEDQQEEIYEDSIRCLDEQRPTVIVYATMVDNPSSTVESSNRLSGVQKEDGGVPLLSKLLLQRIGKKKGGIVHLPATMLLLVTDPEDFESVTLTLIRLS
jgi:hypothetical protein